MTDQDWQRERDAAASRENISALNWQMKFESEPESIPTYAYGIEVGFKRGADFGKAWEAKRAEALTKLATAAVNLWRASQVSYSPTLLAQLELTMHHLYEALAAYKGET